MIEIQQNDLGWFAMGVYQGQEQPVRIGSNLLTSAGETIAVGFEKINDSTIHINALFDPYRCNFPTFEQPIERVCFIQVGVFLINGIPLPVNIHQDLPNYPDSTLPFFVNIPNEYGNQDVKIQTPEYPSWELLAKPFSTKEDLSFYPQQYGGYTRIPFPGINYQCGEYLCAEMNLNFTLDLGDLPYNEDGCTFFNTIDTSELSCDVRLSDQCSANWSYILHLLKSCGTGFTDATQAINYTSYLVVADYNHESDEYIYGVVHCKQYPQTFSGMYLSYLDVESIEEFNIIKKQNGVPNRELIAQNVFSLTNQNIILPPNEDVQIAYQFYTYACATQLINNTYYMHVCDGFMLQIIRNYNNERGWDEIDCQLERSTNNEVNSIFVQTLQDFFYQVKPAFVIF